VLERLRGAAEPTRHPIRTPPKSRKRDDQETEAMPEAWQDHREGKKPHHGTTESGAWALMGLSIAWTPRAKFRLAETSQVNVVKLVGTRNHE